MRSRKDTICSRLKGCRLGRMNLNIRRNEGNLACEQSTPNDASKAALEKKPLAEDTPTNGHEYLSGH